MFIFKVVPILCVILVTVDGRIRNATRFQTKPFLIDDDFCFDNPDFNSLAPNQLDCSSYLACDALGVFELFCPPGEIFDSIELFCDLPGEAICDFEDNPQEPPVDPQEPPVNPPDYYDDECPPDTDEVIFIAGEYCDEYYICINGRPVQFECRLGQHWNKEKEYCDEAHLAGCDDSAHPPIAPECAMNFVGTLPHRGNCNWFWFCDRGNRSLQQCQHLFHYDIDSEACVFMTRAKCVTSV